MEAKTALIVGAFLVIALCGGVLVWFLMRRRSEPNFRSMMGSYASNEEATAIRMKLREDPTGEMYEKIKAQTKKIEKGGGKNKVTIEQRLFQAGMVSSGDQAEFARLRLLAPIVTAPIFCAIFWLPAGPQFGLIGLILGCLIGVQIPKSFLQRKIKRRHDDIMFYLPLVIEQIAIGVSSSLDIGPCLQRIVSMADERDTHNVVTELVRHTQNYIKSGVPFEEAMVETGKASGHTELKHAFMYLSQVAKHGGEITRQLQELADSVSNQRQAYIEGRIKRLEIVATGPVSLVFMGFLIMLLVSFGVQLKNAF